MKRLSILNILSIIFTLISVFICYTTMFTNLYNESGFSFGISQVQLSFVISIIINIIGMFKANQPLNVTLFLINFFRTTHFHYAICYSLILIIVELTI